MQKTWNCNKITDWECRCLQMLKMEWILCGLSYVGNMLRDFPILFSARLVRVRPAARLLFKSKQPVLGKMLLQTPLQWNKNLWLFLCATKTCLKKKWLINGQRSPVTWMQAAIGSLGGEKIYISVCYCIEAPVLFSFRLILEYFWTQRSYLSFLWFHRERWRVLVSFCDSSVHVSCFSIRQDIILK